MIKTVSLAALGNSNPVLLNLKADSKVGLLVNVPSGCTFSGKVQVGGSADGPWNDHDTLTGLTASANGNIDFPIGAVRLSASDCRNGTVTLTVIQADP